MEMAFDCIDRNLRQGDVLSPTLFGLYINDLVQELKEGSKGIQTEFFHNSVFFVCR